MNALAGIKVLDLSRVLAGPWCTQILADFGADVIKVEAPGRGDDTRQWGPPWLTGADGEPVPGASAYYLACNRNKRSLAVDLANPEGAALLRRMAARADIVVENFKVGGLAKYGLDHATLRAAHPRLIVCSITGFGQTGPYAARGGYDYLAQGMGGLMSITGEEDGPPIKSGVAIADLSTGMYAATSILMALRHAERTGEGQHIDLSLLDTQIAMLANQALSWLVGGPVPHRIGNGHPTVVPYRTFEAADGVLIVAVGNDRQFRLLCDELGLPELADDPRYALNAARIVNRAALEEALAARIATLGKAALIERLTARGVPAGPVNTIPEVFADPFVEARQTVLDLPGADGGRVPGVAFPAKLSATPAAYVSAPPGIGEHSREALRDWLSLGDAEFDALVDAGAIA